MKYRLPRTWTHVEHRPVSLLNIPLPRNLGGCQVAAANHFGIVSLRFFQARKMSFRNNEHVCRRFRADVLEGKHMFVLVNFFRRNLAAQYAAKKTIASWIGRHGLTSAKRYHLFGEFVSEVAPAPIP
jgi:hypothetical protein